MNFDTDYDREYPLFKEKMIKKYVRARMGLDKKNEKKGHSNFNS